MSPIEERPSRKPGTPWVASGKAQARKAQTDRQIALLLAALAFALYLRTLAPDVLPGDSGEFQTAAWRWGLAHPTGYPLYLLLGGLWQHGLALFGISPAAALNALSALFGAAAVGLLYLFLVWALPGEVATRRAAAVYGAALLASNVTFWSQALIAEVYTLYIVLLLALLWAALAAARAENKRRGLILTALCLGLGLAHHGMILLAVPGIAIILWPGLRRASGGTIPPLQHGRAWLAAGAALLLPLLLYLYVPLRSGPDASPWLHQRLDGGTLDLIDTSPASTLDFITGRSISVGFRSIGGALAQVGDALWLWRYHFGWIGLILAVLGLYFLARNAPRDLLVATVVYAVLQQLFNLFYNIGDILVYYTPLYLVGAIWAACGAYGAAALARSAARSPALPVWSLVLMLAAIPLGSLPGTARLLNQADSRSARATWEPILEAAPPDAILVSNDRNEIVPLFYFQAVEGRGKGVAGLFPLIAPDDRFANVATTIDYALEAGANRPVYLIKPMNGIEIKFALEAAEQPLVRVAGPRDGTPQHRLDLPYGPLRLVGYDWQPDNAAGVATVRLFWQVEARLDADYATSVQLFDAAGEKLTQDDHMPGGIYHPTSAWQLGEQLVEDHLVALEAPERAVKLLIVLYQGPELAQLAPPLEIELPASGP